MRTLLLSVFFKVVCEDDVCDVVPRFVPNPYVDPPIQRFYPDPLVNYFTLPSYKYHWDLKLDAVPAPPDSDFDFQIELEE